jgi:hypothetical protein
MSQLQARLSRNQAMQLLPWTVLASSVQHESVSTRDRL